MSDLTSDQNDAVIAVLQAVVDRVTSWQDGAEEETVRKELRDAIAESDVVVDGDVQDRIVDHIVNDGSHVDVHRFLR
jgi:hypothetical protein